MTNVLRTINLSDASPITLRDIYDDNVIRSININQINGRFMVTEPFDDDDSVGGCVKIYPSSRGLQVAETKILKSFGSYGSLHGPSDAVFGYIRSKIWIADALNHRVLKINAKTYSVDANIKNKFYYPHALSLDLNTGGIFVKAYDDIYFGHGIIYHFDHNGSMINSFKYLSESDDSSSSESEEFVSSSSSGSFFPNLPSSSSMSYDHVRSRLWWVDQNTSYMVDLNNLQVQSYNLNSDGFARLYNITIEFSSGNALIIAEDRHADKFVLQMFRDNNALLASGYVEYD